MTCTKGTTTGAGVVVVVVVLGVVRVVGVVLVVLVVVAGTVGRVLVATATTGTSRILDTGVGVVRTRVVGAAVPPPTTDGTHQVTLPRLAVLGATVGRVVAITPLLMETAMALPLKMV